MNKLHLIGGRLVTSSAVLVSAVVFLVYFGPRPTPVYADIYVPLASAAGFLSPPPGGPPLRVGRALVNGQSFQYAVGHSRLELDALLSHYERQFKTTLHSTGKQASTATRIQGVGAGVITGVLFRPLAHPSDLIERLRGFAETTRISALGQVHVISAYANNGTDFIDFMPGQDVRLKTLLPAGTEDAPGQDLDGVRRPAGLQRLMTIEHGEGPSWSRTCVYRTPDHAAALSEFCRSLSASGWTKNALLDSSVVYHYSNGRRECLLGGASGEKNGILILVHRIVSGS